MKSNAPKPGTPEPDVTKLRDLVVRLRAPDGCPWDREQTLGDVRAYLLEEAHEAAAAIDEEDWTELAEELGDLLFQVVFVAGLAQEAGLFDLAQVIDTVHAKMIERHPHVFGEPGASPDLALRGASQPSAVEAVRASQPSAVEAVRASQPSAVEAVRASGENRKPPADAAAVRQAWERRKLSERGGRSLLHGVPASLPALTAAYRITQKAAGVGFDWPHAGAVLDKIREELAEVEESLEGGGEGSKEAAREEIGDLLFAVANLARHLEIDPEAALAQGNRKFRRRFGALEESLASQGRSLAGRSLAELDREWEAVKRRERHRG